MTTKQTFKKYENLIAFHAPYCPGSQVLRNEFSIPELKLLSQYASFTGNRAAAMTLNGALIRNKTA